MELVRENDKNVESEKKTWERKERLEEWNLTAQVTWR